MLYLFTIPAYSQNWDEQSGEIEEAEVVIEKNIKIELPFAARNYEKIPPPPIGIRPMPLSYSFLTSSPEIKPILPRLRAVTIQTEDIRKLYGGYVKAGFGNYLAPMVDAYIFTKRNSKYSVGAYGNYLGGFRGSVDKENSASSDLNLGITGSLYGEDARLKATIGYSRLGRYFYGYPDALLVERDTIQQIIHRFEGNLQLDGELSTTPWIYSLGAGYRISADDYDATENSLVISGGIGYKLGVDSKLEINADYNYLLRNDLAINDLSRSLLRIRPGYQFVLNRIQLYAGANMALENDKAEGLDKFHVYPDIRVSYNILDALSVFGGVGGDINNRNLDYWLTENPFLDRNTPIFHSNTNLSVFGGFEGQIANPLSFKLDASFASVKNMSYLMNDSLDIARFTLAYDSLKTTIFELNGELSLQMDKSKLWLRAGYYNYNTGAMTEAWHMPSFDLSIGSTINVYDKILLTGKFNSLFGINAYDPVNQASIELDPVLDLNFQVEYLLSKIAGIFVQANNVISLDNTRYYRYPNRGFQVIAGITVSF